MKKSTIVLIITGVICTITSIICIIAATVRMADMGIDFAQTTVKGQEFVWDTGEDWDWQFEKDHDSSSEDVDVNLPFLQVHVDGDNVQVNMPGLRVDVNEDTDTVSVQILDENGSWTLDTTAPEETAS